MNQEEKKTQNNQEGTAGTPNEAERAFTQSQLDAIVAGRLAGERRK